MYRVKDISVLEELGFKKYRSGYSKKLLIDNCDFIEFDTKELVFKKVKFVETEFIYDEVTYEDLYLIIKKSLNIENEEVKKYIEINFYSYEN